MTMPSRLWSLIWLSLATAACDQPRYPDTPTAVDPNEKARVEEDLSRTEDRTRLALAEKRIAELQKRLDEMAVTPQTVEIDLLKARLTAVEAATFARSEQPPAATPSPAPTRTVPRPTTGSGQKDTARVPLQLRDLESAPRPASQSEKAAFNNGR